jgi:hypothetical protein
VSHRPLQKFVTPVAAAAPSHDVARERDFVRSHQRDFHTVDVRKFNEGELTVWRSGLWRRDWHYGRFGWWYAVGDVWYPYQVPVYPYPVTVADVEVQEVSVVQDPSAGTDLPVVADSGGEQPPSGATSIRAAGPTIVTVKSPAGVEITVTPLPAAPSVSYRCSNPNGVYPEVRLCSAPWISVAQP